MVNKEFANVTVEESIPPKNCVQEFCSVKQDCAPGPTDTNVAKHDLTMLRVMILFHKSWQGRVRTGV